VNFLTGTLIENSEGAGTVVNPSLTYGALDLGGASTQISFYEPTRDVMSNLFKLQIGQGKHWNLYAHSYLYYGVNEALNRLYASLMEGKDATHRLVKGIYNPCLPGGSKVEARSDIHYAANGSETWNFAGATNGPGGFRNAVLMNNEPTGDFEQCAQLAFSLLHKEQNEWCDFSHRGDCSFAGVYQPALPKQSRENFGEFLGTCSLRHEVYSLFAFVIISDLIVCVRLLGPSIAFSGYDRIWNFLELPSRSSIADLEKATRMVCTMNRKDLEKCFQATYALQLLRHGYGFADDDYITATTVLNGQKVGWALGAMMYEINTLPWRYVEKKKHHLNLEGAANFTHRPSATSVFFGGMVLAIVFSIVSVFVVQRRGRRATYEVIGK
jgi:hypothetical protein